jgi:hypothetical protein
MKTFITRYLFTSVTLIAAAILFTGCPYSSEIPLSKMSGKFPTYLLGTWEDPDSKEVRIVITSKDGIKGEIEKTTSSEGSEPMVEKFGVFTTDINGAIFLNVESQDVASVSYYFYKIMREGENKIILLPVTSNIRETFDNSDAMKKFFSENMQNSYFYENAEETYFKVK